MIFLDETMIIKMGSLGLADEVVISVPVQFDDELSVEENMAVYAINLEKAGEQISRGAQRKIIDFMLERSGISPDDIKNEWETASDEDKALLREMGFAPDDDEQ